MMRFTRQYAQMRSAPSRHVDDSASARADGFMISLPAARAIRRRLMIRYTPALLLLLGYSKRMLRLRARMLMRALKDEFFRERKRYEKNIRRRVRSAMP